MTRWELALFALGSLAVASWLRPRVETLIWRTRRAEAEMVLDHLAAALNEQAMRGRDATAFGWTPQPPEQLGTHRVGWPAGALPIDWQPPTATVRCTYQAAASEAGLVITARCDVDGDGVQAVYTSALDGTVSRLTDAQVY